MAGTNYPLLIGAGVALVISGLVGAAAVTGALPLQKGPEQPGAVVMEKTATAAAARKANCRSCGVVAAVRKVEVKGEGGPAVNAVGKDVAKKAVYMVTVRMDDGAERTVTQASAPGYAVGARVKVNGNTLERG